MNSKLAAEIKRRGLKFADTVDGKYEMLSGDEIELIWDALIIAAIVRAAHGKNIEPGEREKLVDRVNALAGRDEAGIIPPGDAQIDRRPNKWWKTIFPAPGER
jgi:hypothetical protein